MTTLSMTAHAKINLFLQILGRRPDGYHTIESLMQSVEFGDEVTVSRKSGGGIQLSCNLPWLPLDNKNIAYKAARLLLDSAGICDGVAIHLEKRIPVAAGMAGGSTNAAAVLTLINRLFDLGISDEKLQEIGLMLGADVPYCLYGGPALAEGIGEKLTPTAGLEHCHIVLVNPGIAVSTAQIYRDLDAESDLPIRDVRVLTEHLKKGNLTDAFGEMVNVMETVAKRHCGQIGDLLTRLREAGADHAMMSGSGATCFGIFQKEPDREHLLHLFSDNLVAVTKPRV